MRFTVQGLLFRSMRMLFLLTVIAGAFSACMASLESLPGSGPPPGAGVPQGSGKPAPLPRR